MRSERKLIEVGSVFAAFVSTAALFGAMTILGYITKVDLTKMGTFGWLGRYRRLSRDFEHAVSSSESAVYLASIRRMLKLATDRLKKHSLSSRIAEYGGYCHEHPQPFPH